jgi:CIC family chloride channel protein
LNNDNELVGLVEFEKVRPHLFKPYGLKFFTLKELISQPKELIFLGEKTVNSMRKFEISHCETLIVLNKGKYYGCLSKVNILESYRTKLKELIIE